MILKEKAPKKSKNQTHKSFNFEMFKNTPDIFQIITLSLSSGSFALAEGFQD